jgi:hypothetical protein
MARKVLFRQTGSADVLRIEEVVTPVPEQGGHALPAIHV